VSPPEFSYTLTASSTTERSIRVRQLIKGHSGLQPDYRSRIQAQPAAVETHRVQVRQGARLGTAACCRPLLYRLLIVHVETCSYTCLHAVGCSCCRACTTAYS